MDDPDVYVAAVSYWRTTCDNLLSSSSASGWQFRGPFRYVDGTIKCDGNPMFDLSNEQQARAIRLIQEESESLPASVRAYMDVRGEDNSVQELVIRCVLTGRSVERVSSLIERWLRPQTTFNEMKANLLMR